MRTRTGLCFVTFASKTVPEKVKVGYEIVQVRPYIQKPMKCNICQKFGHTSSRCENKDKNKFTCGKCAQDHETSACNGNDFKCANCGGPHQSGSDECSILKKETEILAYMKDKEVSYREAKRKVEGLTQKPDTSYAATVTNINPSTNSVSKELEAKNKEIAELKETIKELRDIVKGLSEQVDKLTAASTQQKQQREEEDTKSQERTHLLVTRPCPY